MTREEAKELAPKMIEACYSVDYDNRMELYIDGDEKFIDKIFDEHEAQLKAKDEEIEKLKEEVKYLQSELDDYEQFRETIASARP